MCVERCFVLKNRARNSVKLKSLVIFIRFASEAGAVNERMNKNIMHVFHSFY